MRLRKSTDGSLFAPHRGKPPACPEGYERDPMDEYRFHPILGPCKYRVILSEKSGCCGPIRVMQCKAKNDKVILKSACLACTDKAIKVSIIVINNPQSVHLEKMLQSIYRQLLDDLEIIVLGGDVKELCEKYEACYEPVNIDKALELVTGQLVITTYARIYQFQDCLDTLVAPLLEDKSVICLGKVKIDNGRFLESVEAQVYDEIDIWKQCPDTDHNLLYAMHYSSINRPKGKYVCTEALAIDLGE